MADEARSDPAVNPWRTPKRWILALVVPGLSLAVIAAVALALYVREYTGGMSPWPGPRADPQTVVPPEVPALGLKLLGTMDANSGGAWSAGCFDEGVLALYGVGVDTVVAVWMLRYPGTNAAKGDFDAAAGWATQTTGTTVYSTADFSVPGAAVRMYETPQGAWMTCLHRNWIVAVLADARMGIQPRKLMRAIRDAITEHWRAGAAGSTP